MGDDTILLTIEVARVTYAKNEWACVQATLDDRQPDEASELPSWLKHAAKVTVTGDFGQVQPGDLFDVEGASVQHPRFGRQINATQVMVCARRDERALYSFLRKLPHIGPQRASLVIRQFGGADEVFHLLDNEPERLAEVKGISSERAVQAAEAFRALEGERDAWLLCRELALPSWLTSRILDRLGRRARATIYADPFYLMTCAHLSFRDCDLVRTKLGIAEDDPRRLAAGALVVLQAAGQSGDCWSSEHHLFGGGVDYRVEKARQSVSMSDALLRQGLDVLQQPIVVEDTVTLPPRAAKEDDRLYLAEVYDAEKTVCRRIRAMLEE